MATLLNGNEHLYHILCLNHTLLKTQNFDLNAD